MWFFCVLLALYSVIGCVLLFDTYLLSTDNVMQQICKFLIYQNGILLILPLVICGFMHTITKRIEELNLNLLNLSANITKKEEAPEENNKI